MHKNAITIIPLMSLLVLILIQVYIIYGYYQVKSDNFDLNYSDVIKTNMNEREFEGITDSLNITLNAIAYGMLFKTFDHSDSAYRMNVYNQFYTTLKEYDENDQEIKAYTKENKLDTIFETRFVIRRIALLRMDGTETLVYSNENQRAINRPRGLFIKSYYKEGDYYSVQYDYFVDFTHKPNIIFSEMSGLMLLVILTLTLVTITFFYTLRTLHHQKKLTEVKDDFINNITHEFKTPLSVVNVAVSSLKQPDIMANRQRYSETCNILDKQNKYLSKMIDNVISVSLLDKKKPVVGNNKINIIQHTDEIIESFLATETSGKAISIHKNYQVTDNFMYTIDPTDFSSLLQNLLSNSVKYCTLQPEIRINLHQNTNFVIEIVDNGIGIDETMQSKIFQKFFREPREMKAKGLGLGLYIVKQVVQKYGGEISLKSEVNKGTMFRLSLPL